MLILDLKLTHFISTCSRATALQIRVIQRSISAIFGLLTAHIYPVMIIVTGSFSRKLFLLLLLFPRNSFEHFELVFLEFNHFYKTRRISLFCFYLSFFTCCFAIILRINTLPFCTSTTAFKHTG